MNRAALSPLFLALLAVPACAGAAPPTSSAPSAPAAPAPEAIPPASAAAELSEKGALVSGKLIPLDGVAEGLAWPALRDALHRRPGDHSPLVLAAPRATPLATVLRAVWTLRDANIRLQTPDVAGVTHVIELRPKPDAPSAGCHLAVFVAPNGDLRVAAPGGPRTIPGPDAAEALARALVEERKDCALRYVAFGAENAEAAWSAVFDVAWTVERGKAAGDARYSLGEPVHYAAK
jgi:hypothetical protein